MCVGRRAWVCLLCMAGVFAADPSATARAAGDCEVPQPEALRDALVARFTVDTDPAYPVVTSELERITPAADAARLWTSDRRTSDYAEAVDHLLPAIDIHASDVELSISDGLASIVAP